MAIVVALTGLLLAGLGISNAAPPAWPVDIEIVERAPRYANHPDSPETVQDILENAERVEVSTILSRDVIVLGTVTGLESFLDGRNVFTRVSVRVEECLKGHCGSGVTDLIAPGGSVDGRRTVIGVTGPPWMGPSGIDLPVVGDRYLFLVQRDGGDPSILRTGGVGYRYLIVDGVVARKDILLEEFVALINSRLGPRRPEALFEVTDAVVLALVTDVNSCPREDPSCTPNFVTLDVEAVGKGTIAPGATVRVELPYLRDRGHDFPRFQVGERDVVFLQQAADRTWTLADGWDSRLRVLADGSFEGFGSLSDLAAAADTRCGPAGEPGSAE